MSSPPNTYIMLVFGQGGTGKTSWIKSWFDGSFLTDFPENYEDYEEQTPIVIDYVGMPSEQQFLQLFQQAQATHKRVHLRYFGEEELQFDEEGNDILASIWRIQKRNHSGCVDA